VNDRDRHDDAARGDRAEIEGAGAEVAGADGRRDLGSAGAARGVDGGRHIATAKRPAGNANPESHDRGGRRAVQGHRDRAGCRRGERPYRRSAGRHDRVHRLRARARRRRRRRRGGRGVVAARGAEQRDRKSE